MSAASGVPPPERVWPWPTGRGSRLDALVATLIVAETVALFLLERGGFFYVDDFLNLRLAQVSSLSLRYLFIPNFQHVEPGVRLEYWIVMHVIGLHYDTVLAILLVMIGLTNWVLYRVLRRLFAPSAWMFGLALLFGIWAGWLGASTWLAAGFEVVPSALASALTVYAFCRRLEGGGDFWIALTGCAFAAGLAFYESTMVVIPVLVLFLIAVSVERSATSDWHTLVRRAAAPLAWCVVAAAAFISVFLTKLQVPVGSAPPVGTLLAFLWNSWSRSFAPSLLGGPVLWQWTGPRGSGAAPPWLVAASELVVLAAVVVTLRRTGGRAIIGWGLVAVPFVLLLSLVGWARIHEFGLGIGQDYQYQVDVFVPAILGLAFLTMGRPQRRNSTAKSVVAQRVLAVTAAVAYSCSFAASAVPAAARWSTYQGSEYVANLEAGVKSVAKRYPGNWSLYNTTIPIGMLFESAWPYTNLESFTRLWGLASPIDVPGSHLFVVTANGSVVAASLPPLVSIGRTCNSAGGSVEFRMPRPVVGGIWTVRIEVPGHQGEVVRAEVSSTSRRALSSVGAAAVAASGGGTALVSFYWPSSIRWLSIGVTRAPSLCVASIVVGNPAPRRSNG